MTRTTLPCDSIMLTEVQIWPVRNPDASRIKAMASLTLNGALRLNGCKIIEGSKGLFLAYPSEKKAGTDQYVPFFHTTDKEVNERIQTKVLEEYKVRLAV
ncbi:MAG: septation protein SpoVG family protein [Fibrobacteres bacterium]|nr:septation protein SpoVG family protein [Fibrobacterota bacterium]